MCTVIFFLVTEEVKFFFFYNNNLNYDRFKTHFIRFILNYIILKSYYFMFKDNSFVELYYFLIVLISIDYCKLYDALSN